MEKRSIIHSDSELETPKLVRLVLLKAVTLKATGKITGNEYNFNGAGSQVDVDEKDVEHFLSRVARSCCSGNTFSPYFEIVR
jgi:hypothetical protein